MSARARRAEILETAAALFATSGLRTSLKDIASACGILPGSLYHHFDSKEAILIELVNRYQEDLNRVAGDARASLSPPTVGPVDDLVIEFGRTIAACAARHRAALLLTMYEPPLSASEEFASLARRTPTAVIGVMRDILEYGRSQGTVRAEVDLELLADRLCQSMLHYGIGDSPRVPGADTNPDLRCRILLRGLAATTPLDQALDRSDALRCARTLVAGWQGDDTGTDQVSRIRSAAKAEFGRRGYEATGMREVAAAAGVTISVVYRQFRSKEALLESVMQPYAEERRATWDAVLQSGSSALEMLDALIWVNIRLLDRFSDEFRIQVGWLRDSPPNTAKLGSTAEQRRNMRELLDDGERAGVIRFAYGDAESRARCVYEALWTPENIVRTAGIERSHTLARETVLGGALTRSEPDGTVPSGGAVGLARR